MTLSVSELGVAGLSSQLLGRLNRMIVSKVYMSCRVRSRTDLKFMEARSQIAKKKGGGRAVVGYSSICL